MPGTYQAVYVASTSCVQSLTEALQEELKDTAVPLTSLMPVPTETEFFARADMLDTPVGSAGKDDAAQVAQQGLDALSTGERKVLAASLMTKVQGGVTGVLPDALKAKAHAGRGGSPLPPQRRTTATRRVGPRAVSSADVGRRETHGAATARPPPATRQ